MEKIIKTLNKIALLNDDFFHNKAIYMLGESFLSKKEINLLLKKVNTEIIKNKKSILYLLPPFCLIPSPRTFIVKIRNKEDIITIFNYLSRDFLTGEILIINRKIEQKVIKQCYYGQNIDNLLKESKDYCRYSFDTDSDYEKLEILTR